MEDFMKKQQIIQLISTLLLFNPNNLIYESGMRKEAIKKNTRKSNLEYKIDKDEITTEKRINIALEEAALLKKDKTFQIIHSYYKNKNFIIPKYITPKFVRCLIEHESGNDKYAISKVGAKGLGQIMEATWYEVGERNYNKNAFIPEINIRATIKYLCLLDRKISNIPSNWKELADEKKLEIISAAYNGGLRKLKGVGWDVNKMKEETQKYFPYILKESKKFIPSAEIYQSAL